MADDDQTTGEKLATLIDGMLNEQAILIAGPIGELMVAADRLAKGMDHKLSLVTSRLGRIIDKHNEALHDILREVTDAAMRDGVY
jgi:hypothetical protein